jgi:CBS domain-containing protein
MPDTTVMHAKRFGVYTCSPDSTLFAAGTRMVDEDISALVVVDNDGLLSGILTRSDLLRAHVDGVDCQQTPASAYMTCDVVTVGLGTTMREVAEILSARHIHRVVAVRTEENRVRPVAVVSAADVLYHFVKATNRNRSNSA